MFFHICSISISCTRSRSHALKSEPLRSHSNPLHGWLHWLAPFEPGIKWSAYVQHFSRLKLLALFTLHSWRRTTSDYILCLAKLQSQNVFKYQYRWSSDSWTILLFHSLLINSFPLLLCSYQSGFSVRSISELPFKAALSMHDFSAVWLGVSNRWYLSLIC